MSESTKQTQDRYCPICEEWMLTEVCPKDEVPTIRRDSLEEKNAYIPEGTILGGRYRIIRLIGLGGMGEVYLGTQTNMDRRVAIKTLKKEFMSNERLLKRFYREARAAAALDHPNIVKVYDFGLDPEQGCPYIAMEYLEGISLDELIENEGKLSEARTCLIVGSVARALTDAHSKGVVHRDLKPDNVHVQSLTDGTEHVKVLDFGIAKIRRPDGTPTEKLTGTGMALGTPYYMSPEQAMGKPADFRSDLYSLGCIIYQLLAGRLPFDAEQPMAVLLKQLREPAPPLPAMLSNGEAPTDAIRFLYASLMAKNVDERPSSTLAVADRLKDCVRLSRGESLDSTGQEFEFGNQTLGPRVSKKPKSIASAPGLETLLATSMGEKATLAFGVVDDESDVRVPDPGMESTEVPFDTTSSKRLKPMILAASVLFVGAIAAYFFSNQTEEPVVTQIELPSETQTLTKPTVSDDMVRDIKVVEAPQVDITRVAITSVPNGATVKNGEKVLGVTPFESNWQTTDLPASLTLQLEGYVEAGASITVDAPRLSVNLKQRVPIAASNLSTTVPDVKQKTSAAKPARSTKAQVRSTSDRKRIRPRRGLKNVRRKLKTDKKRARNKSGTTKSSKPKSSGKDVMETW